MVDRPREVTAGTLLLGLSIVAAMLQLTFNAVGLGNMKEPPPFSLVVFFAGWLAFQLFLVWLAHNGRNWARWLASAFAVLALATISAQIEVARASGSHPLVVLGLAASAAAPVGAVVLFLPRSSAWYAAINAR